jgi:hypothetical protein
MQAQGQTAEARLTIPARPESGDEVKRIAANVAMLPELLRSSGKRPLGRTDLVERHCTLTSW